VIASKKYACSVSRHVLKWHMTNRTQADVVTAGKQGMTFNKQHSIPSYGIKTDMTSQERIVKRGDIEGCDESRVVRE